MRSDPQDGFPADARKSFEAWEDKLQEGADEANRELLEQLT